MIFCKTTIGYGSPAKAGTADAHGAPLGDEEILKTRKALDWNHEPFNVPESVYEFWNAVDRGLEINDELELLDGSI
jgi:transketolase